MALDDEIARLIVRARLEDRKALTELFRIVKPQLDLWSAQLLQHGTVGLSRPSDVAQDTALRAFNGFSSFRGASAKELWAWLRTILERQVSQAARDSGRQKRGQDQVLCSDSLIDSVPSSQPSPSQVTAEVEKWRHLLGQIFYLPDAQREAVVLCLLKQLPVEKAAVTLECSRATIVGLLQRAVKTLNGKLADLDSMAPSVQDATGSAVLTWLERLEYGQHPDQEQFLAEHSDCRDELAELIHWIETIRTSSSLDIGESG